MELRPRSGSLAASASFQTDPGSFGDGHSKLIRKHFTHPVESTFARPVTNSGQQNLESYCSVCLPNTGPPCTATELH